jgi:hypothetical protein
MVETVLSSLDMAIVAGYLAFITAVGLLSQVPQRRCAPLAASGPCTSASIASTAA